MKYMLLMYASESIGPGFTPEQLAAEQQSWFAYVKEIQASGVLVMNNGLLPTSNATTVRAPAGKTLITDGPFAETHEQLAGFFVLDCKDIDEAVHWAAKLPTAKYGSVEIRPMWSPG